MKLIYDDPWDAVTPTYPNINGGLDKPLVV